MMVLAWSGPNIWKSEQEPDGPAFEHNPSELPKTQFVEKGENTLLGVYSEAKSTNVAEDDIPVMAHWLPGVGPNVPIV